MKKRFLAMFLALVMCLALLPTAAVAVDKVEFIITDYGTLEKYNGKGGDVVIPDTVKTIQSFAFARCENLTSVTIPSSVTRIFDGAFDNCPNLVSVTIPESVTSIGNSVFCHCPKLTNAVIPNGVVSIGSFAFSETGLTNATIPSSVTNLGESAFMDCPNLTAIQVDADNPNYCSRDGVLFSKDMTTLIQYPNKREGAYAIPAGVVNIGEGSFHTCHGLSGVTIPDGIINIGTQAFEGCTGLTSVIIPDSVTTIEWGVFSDCESLVNAKLGSGIKTIGNYAFCDCHLLTELEIPNSVTSIGNGAFVRCWTLDHMDIPNSVVSLGQGVFYACTGLNRVTLSKNITEIGDQTFWACENLTEVTIPNGVTSIGECAFLGCDKLTNVDIPNSVTQIGESAFQGCVRLVTVYIPDKVAIIEGITFESCDKLASVFIPRSVVRIEGSAFSYCESLKDVYYAGTEDEWKAIKIKSDNKYLKSATVHYNSPMPEQPATPDQPAIQFSDVKAGDWFYGAVNWAVEKGITNGTGDGFSPNADCTHDHILTFLWRAAGEPESAAKLSFTPKNDWAAGALAWACEQGMISADIDENAACTSAAAVVYIWQAKGKPAAGYDGRFTDVAQDAAYAPAVAWAVDSGVTNGTSATTFGPSTVCSRARIVTFLQRTFQ